jgi:hypothetical protein
MTSRELQWYVSGSLCGSHPSEGDRYIASLKPRVRHQVDAAFVVCCMLTVCVSATTLDLTDLN